MGCLRLRSASAARPVVAAANAELHASAALRRDLFRNLASLAVAEADKVNR